MATRQELFDALVDAGCCPGRFMHEYQKYHDFALNMIRHTDDAVSYVISSGFRWDLSYDGDTYWQAIYNKVRERS